MKKLLAFFLFAGLALAQDVTFNVPITIKKDDAAAVNAWRLTQKNPDNTLKYATNAALLKSIIAESIKRILDQTPSAAIAVEQAKIDAAKAQIEALKAAAVQ